jgi:hypothetical protein
LHEEQTVNMNRSILSVVLLAAMAAGAACGGRDDTISDTASGTIDSNAPLRVADLTLGRAIDANRKVVNSTDNFTISDTIYASVRTTGTGANATLLARWMFEDTTLVNEHSQIVSPMGEEHTEFHITKATPWPVGKYKVTILLNGVEAESESFTIK